ncbi:MAG TPA: hypothetical protein VKA18_16175 [Alphaproteobacteria bacterium]|nr:hypothetical protein [Alphaproteobacteria bacterium]
MAKRAAKTILKRLSGHEIIVVAVAGSVLVWGAVLNLLLIG